MMIHNTMHSQLRYNEAKFTMCNACVVDESPHIRIRGLYGKKPQDT